MRHGEVITVIEVMCDGGDGVYRLTRSAVELSGAKRLVVFA